MSSGYDDGWGWSNKTWQGPWHEEPWHHQADSWHDQGQGWHGDGDYWHGQSHQAHYMTSMPRMQGSHSTPNFPPAPKPGEFVFPLPGQRPVYDFNNGPKGAAAAVILKPKTDMAAKRRTSAVASLPDHIIEIPPQIWRQACRHHHDIDDSRCSCCKYDPSIWLPSSLFNDLTFVLDAKPFAQSLLDQAAIPCCNPSDFFLYIRPQTSKSLGPGRYLSYKLREGVKHLVTEKLNFLKLPRPEKLEYDLNCVLLPLMLRFSEEYCAVKKNLKTEDHAVDQLRKFLGDAPKKSTQPPRPKILCSCGHGSLWHSEVPDAHHAMEPDDTICIKGNSKSFRSAARTKDLDSSKEADLENFCPEVRRERHEKASCQISGGRLVKPSQTLRSASSSLGFAQSSQPQPQFSTTTGFRSRASLLVQDAVEELPQIARPSAVRKSVRGSLLVA
eukprot:gnl/MRDRNA2_/MRDRNA2_46600_c0_seq1.p1 gnl/MRDRNA2_/MRDRNA2_46600_c0~~gnl/MRDRNA2_/MRDRNA2_46600_c0_seq1.p1  ORF type:complete len:480 (-),score=56.09 gnl/MRDRNA2_/MRDRNA2_46600_c0_seq1:17-1342(-)